MQVAELCREQMHTILAEELATAAEHYLTRREEDGAEEQAWRAALSRCFVRVDALAPAACACGRVPTTADGCACPLWSVERGAIVGSTAVVALLVRDRLVVANCGDSRAVLCRDARDVPLSDDHKVTLHNRLFLP
jgi:protein phosphatase 2C